MNEPFWENAYRDDSLTAFGSEPNRTIKKYLPQFKRGSTVLEVGCGDGKNALYLAQKHLEVDAFDISRNGIARLMKSAARDKIPINAWVQDLRRFQFRKKYDLITSHGTLHFVDKEAWQKFLKEARRQTVPGGMHIIQIFTDKIPASPDIAPYVKGLASEGELKTLYSADDWEIIEFLAYIFEDEHPGVARHLHASNKIVARKRKSERSL